MSTTLSLESLAVESFSTELAGSEFEFDAVAAKSKNYSECDSCGIACTYDCPVPSANYTDCGSCGIACTAIEPC